MRTVARGTLGYAVAFADQALYTIELDERFALFVRDPDTGAVRARYDVGPAERDLLAVAVADGVAWIGGDDQQVRGIDVTSGHAVATWSVGAPVTALAVIGAYLVIGDGTGVVCVRRRTDGALLSCLALADTAIESFDQRPNTVAALTRGGTVAIAVPSLTTANAVAANLVVHDRDVIVDGRVVAHFAGSARAVARGPRGQLVAVGWIRDLDDPSVIWIAPPRPGSPVPRH
jgi:hypothetical protein